MATSALPLAPLTPAPPSAASPPKGAGCGGFGGGGGGGGGGGYGPAPRDGPEARPVTMASSPPPSLLLHQQQQHQQHPAGGSCTVPGGGACGSRRSARRVGDYEVGKTLGTGATGKVKIARRVGTGEVVAIKAISKAVLMSKAALAAKVKREIAILKLLGGVAEREFGGCDVGVMKLLDVYETEQYLLLVLEYCAGGDLFEAVLNNGYFSSDEALAIFQQLVLALNFAHHQGVVHRDLKLENLLITEGGHLKVADFGMASLLMPGSLLETACGSPNYCAPEVLSGELYNGAAADVWSCGVILFALVTGGLPFDDDNFSRLLSKVRAGVFTIPDEVHPPVAELIRGMLQVNPVERLSVSDIMQTPWFNSQPLPSHLSAVHKLSSGQESPSAASRESQGSRHVNGEGGVGSEEVESSSTIHLSSDKPPPLRLDDRCCEVKPREHDPVSDPVMSIVAHLSELGLGEIPTIIRRLKGERPCIEKDFYERVSAFVGINATESQSLSEELPVSPNTDANTNSFGIVPVGSTSLPVSLAEAKCGGQV